MPLMIDFEEMTDVVFNEKPSEQLPTGDDAYSASVRSVYNRGFHAVAPHAALDWRISAQFIRLMEELAEFTESASWEPFGERTMSEIADVLIVLAQLAWLTGLDPATLKAEDWHENELIERVAKYKRNPMVIAGWLARSLRKSTHTDDPAVHRAIQAIAEQMHFRVAAAKVTTIEGVIVSKCQADETRGFLHGG